MLLLPAGMPHQQPASCITPAVHASAAANHFGIQKPSQTYQGKQDQETAAAASG
jgi:hypothetical protein